MSDHKLTPRETILRGMGLNKPAHFDDNAHERRTLRHFGGAFGRMHHGQDRDRREAFCRRPHGNKTHGTPQVG